MPQIIPVGLNCSKRDTAESVNLQNTLRPLVVRNNDDIRFLSHANLVADRVDAFLLLVSVECKIIETAVGESVTVI